MNEYVKRMEYIGDLDQLMTLKESVLSGGFQEGVKAIEIANGGNLSATILPGRCMDIYQVRYKGKNMNYLAPCGIKNSSYYDSGGKQWLRSFFVGMLTTCGLQHFGNPKIIDGVEMGLHGRISSTPAEDVRCIRGADGGNPTISLEGTMRESRIFGENLTLHRQILFGYEQDSITIRDEITNHGFGNRAFVYAYHLNYGYPLLEEGTKLMLDVSETIPREENAAKYLDSWNQVGPPEYPYPERCYFHKLRKDENDRCQYTLYNEKRQIGVRVQYNGNDLPYFCEWKMLGKGEYVLGLEPMNIFLDGPSIGEEGCMAPVLTPGESKVYEIKINFIDGSQI